MGEDEVNLGADKENCAAGVGASEEEGFEPTEDELVLHFLRPQLRGFAPRVAGAVVEADPCAAAPWELLERHGLRGRGQGYFFAARRRGRHLVRRSLEGGGGSWMHSSTKDDGRSVTELGVVVRWCRTRYCFYVRGGEELDGQMRSTGWVMAEYEITDPRCYRRADDGEEDEYWVLCHVRKSVRSRRDVSSPKGSRTRRR